MTVYGIPDFRKAKNPTETFCSLVGRVKGKVGKGGVPDKIESARGIIKDWNDGLIKFYSVPPEEDLGKEEATIVERMGEEFDWKKMDEGVGGGEMEVEDCIGMRGGEMGGDLEEFNEEEEDMEEEEEEEEESEEEEEEEMEVEGEKMTKGTKKFTRKELEEAEDFF